MACICGSCYIFIEQCWPYESGVETHGFTNSAVISVCVRERWSLLLKTSDRQMSGADNTNMELKFADKCLSWSMFQSLWRPEKKSGKAS